MHPKGGGERSGCGGWREVQDRNGPQDEHRYGTQPVAGQPRMDSIQGTTFRNRSAYVHYVCIFDGSSSRGAATAACCPVEVQHTCLPRFPHYQTGQLHPTPGRQGRVKTAGVGCVVLSRDRVPNLFHAVDPTCNTGSENEAWR